MDKTLLAALFAALFLTLMPANAATVRPNGYPVTNVNLRAGPGTYYPVIVVVPSRIEPCGLGAFLLRRRLLVPAAPQSAVAL